MQFQTKDIGGCVSVSGISLKHQAGTKLTLNNCKIWAEHTNRDLWKERVTEEQGQLSTGACMLGGIQIRED